MALITQQYLAAKFNGLPHIDHDGLANIDRSAETLVAAIISEGLERHVGLWNPHKHFDVANDEQIVSRRGKSTDKWVVMTEVEKYNPMNIPCAWKTVDGVWSPMQFVRPDFPGAQESCAALLDKVKTLLPKIDRIIKESGLEGRVGLHLATDTGHKKDKFLMERTDETKRVQRFNWETEEPGMWTTGEYIKTYWVATQGENGAQPKAGCHISHGGCATQDHNST